MSDINNIIKDITDSVSVSKQKFVYYEKETGIIKEITNRKQDRLDLECLSVELEEVIDILNGKKSTVNFKVEYNHVIKDYQLVELNSLTEPSTFLCKITQKNKTDDGFTIIQNNKNKCWSFMLSDQIEQDLKKKIITEDHVKIFYIVEKGNPDILLESVSVSFINLLFDPEFTIQFSKNYNDIEVDILTQNYFNNYNLEVIND